MAVVSGGLQFANMLASTTAMLKLSDSKSFSAGFTGQKKTKTLEQTISQAGLKRIFCTGNWNLG